MADTEKAAKEEAKFSRKEKQEDDALTKKLVEVYGPAPKRAGGGARRTKSWRCAECNYDNFESRMACGQCLAKNPLVVREDPDMKQAGHSNDPNIAILHVQDRCYRCYNGVSPQQHKRRPVAATAAPVQTYSYTDEKSFQEEDEDDDEEAKIQYDPATKQYTLSLDVHPRFYKFLIGIKGQTLLETQRLTETSISIPRSKQGEGEPDSHIITVRGPTANNVRAAHVRIFAIMMEAKDKVEYTHFISIPLGPIPSVNASVRSFLSDVMSACCSEESRVEPSLFQNPDKLHLTLLMLRLFTQEEINLAQNLLVSLQPEIAKIFEGDDFVTLKGLNYMNDDPKEVHVLYLEIEKDECFRKLAEAISLINETFISAGIAQEKDVAHNEKLHATIVNSKWRESKQQGGGPRVPFDATSILNCFGKACIGSHRLARIDLSILGSNHQADDGYYCSECQISIH